MRPRRIGFWVLVALLSWSVHARGADRVYISRIDSIRTPLTPGFGLYEVSGVIVNDTDYGIYDISTADIEFRNSDGRLVGTMMLVFSPSSDMVVGTPAVIGGKVYEERSPQQSLDYIPPRSKGYFLTSPGGSIPSNYSISESRFDISHKWAEEARISREVSIVEETVAIQDSAWAGSYGEVRAICISGMIRNEADVAVEGISLRAVLIRTDGHVADIGVSSQIVWPGTIDKVVRPGEVIPFGLFAYQDIPLDEIGEVRLTVVWGYDRTSGSNPPDLPSGDPQETPVIEYRPVFVTVPDTVVKTVHDTIRVGVADSGHVTQPILLGDLNNDLVVDFADFLMFAGQYGKRAEPNQ